MHLLRPSIFDRLRAHGERPAIITRETTLSYAQLAALVDAARRRLGPNRQLVALSARNDVSSLTWLIAALTDRHAVILSSADGLAALVEAYDPDVVIDDGDITHDRRGTRHDLHPDLALLLSTSGSTGSAKTVRISHTNLIANAESIVEYLGITPDDRALTTLPIHYCYGLSVVTSHLLAGASLALTDWSVVDPCLWDFAEQAAITSFAGVPYTFEMLDAQRLRAPESLRYITQAGGRLDAARVRQWAASGSQQGWEFVVMYGQTEATARMAYLPPHLAQTHPHALGIPIPGGWLRLDPVDGQPDGIGELVYTGENVMLGYASSAADLWRGGELKELRTGDLAAIEDGLFVWKGRRSRVAKCFGLRIDLDHVERMLADSGLNARAVQADPAHHGGAVHVFVEQAKDVARALELAEHHTRLPRHAIGVARVAQFPRTASGKVDYQDLRRQAAAISRGGGPQAASVRDLYATLLCRPTATVEDSFASLGGDSLSYVELSVRLGERGIDLPADWHDRPIRELEAAPVVARRTVRADTSILLRALAIVLIVSTHSNVVAIPGGAHLLLAIAGYNFARFGLGSQRLRHGLATVARVAIPSALWIGAVTLLTGEYDWPTAFMLNGVFGADQWTDQWRFWFLEAYIWFQVTALLVTAVPVVARTLHRSGFASLVGATLVALAARYAQVGVEANIPERYTPTVIVWCFLAGWTAATASTARQRVIAGLLVTVGTAGFFGDPAREAVVIGGVITLLLWPTVRMPRQVVKSAGVLAGASLFIYLTHWQVYPHLEVEHPVLGLVASLAVGVLVWRGWDAITAQARRVVSRPDRPLDELVPDRGRTRRRGRPRGVPASTVPAPQAASRPAR